ncbi:hypothetical protein BS78_K201100 [Paspalum vaginatum]|uniref:Uncharacterized protein n=1 Tax=Paspalum vaginatum TaxID=158149 RepID=A0A9W8CDN8_9POAL|nr:hypothetical protein BS78_K201100 [Paspalum vaginatum]
MYSFKAVHQGVFVASFASGGRTGAGAGRGAAAARAGFLAKSRPWRLRANRGVGSILAPEKELVLVGLDAGWRRRPLAFKAPRRYGPLHASRSPSLTLAHPLCAFISASAHVRPHAVG